MQIQQKQTKETKARTEGLPLPKGEGRGEGEEPNHRAPWFDSCTPDPRAGILVFLILLLFSTVPSVEARINVVTLPDRDSVQLTIYNSVDLTLVKETRMLVFRKGLNKLEFSWANTRIDPTSVEFKARTHADEVEVLDVSFPPRVANTLEWRIQSEVAGEVEVEIRYFTSGISWAADYTAEAGQDEKRMSLAAQVRVNNQSGEDYENAQVRLVVGVVRLVEQIAKLAREAEDRGRVQVGSDKLMLFDAVSDAVQEKEQLGRATGMGTMGGRGGGGGGRNVNRNKAVEIAKEELSEYFLYTVDQRDTIPNGWSKRLPSFKQSDVPITSYYKFEREQWGDRVMRYYRFTNSEPSHLGKEPLPDGIVKAFRLANVDRLYAYVGSTQVKYIPVNEFVEMELGNDQEVLVKPSLVNWEKTDLHFDNNGDVKGWTIKETWEIETQNSKEIDIVLDLRRNFTGDWDLKTEAHYEKMEATKVKFVVPLKAREKQTIRYELTTRYGLNVTR